MTSAMRSSQVAVLHLVRTVDKRCGRVSWSLRYRDPENRPLKMALGEWPVVTLKQAQELAQDTRFKPGLDPLASRRAPRRERPNTVEKMVRLYIERYAKPNTRSWAVTQEMFERDVLPLWGRRQISSIRRDEVADLLGGIMERGSPYMAIGVHAILRMLWRWAIDRGYVQTSPIEGMHPPARPIARDRVLTDAELVAIWQSADRMGWRYGAVVRLLFLTGQRLFEVAGAKWSELNLDEQLWSIPRERMKTATLHEVPLSEDATRLVERLPRLESSEHLFPAYPNRRNGSPHIQGFGWAKRQMDEFSGVENWRLHDIRRTVATRIQGLGFRIEVTEDILGHTKGSRSTIVRTYQRHQFKHEKRQALEAWAQSLKEIIARADSPRVVVPLHT
jgi:integrase